VDDDIDEINHHHHCLADMFEMLYCFVVVCIQMLASASDPHLGGRDIDLILAEHFSNDFQSRYRIDPRSNPRAFLRLTAEVEKLKKQMSANSTTLPLNIECFMDDKDVHGEMKRYGDMLFGSSVFLLITAAYMP
jgi:molecular chaperone DnaK (HSP70)